MPRGNELVGRPPEVRFLHEEDVRVEGGNEEDADPRGGERLGDGGSHTDSIKREGTDKLQRPPADLAPDARRDALGEREDGKLGRGSRYRHEAFPIGPGRDGGAGVETRDGVTAGEEAEDQGRRHRRVDPRQRFLREQPLRCTRNR